MKLFEYAVIYNPKSKKEGDESKSELIVPVTTVLAANKENAAMVAARAIPEKYIDKLDRIEVAVRPF
jgi:hypothetical protein